jgi:hypothetical protein
LNGYGDNGQRKVWSSLGFHALYLSADSLIKWCVVPVLAQVPHAL